MPAAAHRSGRFALARKVYLCGHVGWDGDLHAAVAVGFNQIRMCSGFNCKGYLVIYH